MAYPSSSTFPHSLFLSSSLLLLTISSLTIPTSHAQPPKALILPISKDPSTLQYTTTIKQRTPLIPIKLVIHLGGDFLWVNCEKGYVSSSYRSPHCESAECFLATSSNNTCGGECYGAPKPGCSNNTCGLFPYNPFIRTSSPGEVAMDVLSLQSTDGRNPSPSHYVTLPRFLFVCGWTSLSKKLARGASGIAGLNRYNISLPSQLSMAFNLPRKFAICLPSSSTSNKNNGVTFFGDGPYVTQNGFDVSKPLIYTPLIVNPVSTITAYQGTPSYEYFIGVRSIRVNEKVVRLNTTLLSINKKSGEGGTKISTAAPYTVMQRPLYKALTEAFANAAAAMKLKRVEGVAPFKVCFSSEGVGRTRVGPAVPTIDLVLQNEKVVWRVFGANSMVQVRDGVMCLGFVDGGLGPITAIVIGGHQLEDNLLQFDLGASRLGFSSSLLFRQTTCSNFNFTSKV